MLQKYFFRILANISGTEQDTEIIFTVLKSAWNSNKLGQLYFKIFPLLQAWGGKVAQNGNKFLAHFRSFQTKNQLNLARYESWLGPCKKSAQLNENWPFYAMVNHTHPKYAAPKQFFMPVFQQYPVPLILLQKQWDQRHSTQYAIAFLNCIRILL